MLSINFHPIFELRGIKKPLAFMVKCGLTYNTAWRFNNGKIDRVDIKHLSNLCVALSCTPNDVLQWNSHAETVLPPNHPLHALKPAANTTSIPELLQNFPLDKLAELQKAIENLKQ
jgi:DNA-binding Xre family transcriptional regulator